MKLISTAALNSTSTLTPILEVNAYQTFVCPVDPSDTDKGYRVSQTRGGRSSLSGKTLEPAFCEEGSIVAYREDQVASLLVAKFKQGEEKGYENASSLPCPLVAFTGHGTEPEGIEELDVEDLWNGFVAWARWRGVIVDEFTQFTRPDGRSREGRIAKWATRDLQGALLTAGEAMDGLPNRAGTFGYATLEIEDNEDGTFGWFVRQEGVGKAWGESSSDCSPPEKWGFFRDGETHYWKDEEHEYLSTYSVKDDRWCRSRRLLTSAESSWEHEQTEDEGDWAQFPV